jgi:hypothetical protein
MKRHSVKCKPGPNGILLWPVYSPGGGLTCWVQCHSCGTIMLNPRLF